MKIRYWIYVLSILSISILFVAPRQYIQNSEALKIRKDIICTDYEFASQWDIDSNHLSYNQRLYGCFTENYTKSKKVER